MTTFYVEIEMGNAAMEFREDLSDALKKVAASVHCHNSGEIRDYNGNIVGKFGFKGKYPLKADPDES